MEADGHGKGASSSSAAPSRLSPLAQPFSLNPFTRQPPWSSLTSVDPCANFNLEDDHEPKTTFGDVFQQYPSANAGLDFGFMPSAANETLPDYTELSAYGHGPASFSSNKDAIYPYESLLEQGMPAVKGLKPNGDNSERAHEKCSGLTIGRETPFISRSADQVHTGFHSFSAVNSVATPFEFSTSVTSSTAMLQNCSQVQLPYSAPAVNWSHCNSKIGSCESGSKFDPFTAKSTVFHSPKHNAFPAVVLESSDTSTTVSPLNPILSKNVDFNGNGAVNNYDSSSKCSPSGIKDLHHLMSGEGKDSKPLYSEGIGPLLTANSEPLISLTNIPYDFSLEHLGAREAVSLAGKLDENDPDLDSPCWKGTLASRQSPFGVSRSLSSDFVEYEQEARNSLNPLAPHFFPRQAKTIVSYLANDCIGDDFSSFQKGESSAVNSFSEGHGPVGQAGSRSSLLINGIGTPSSSDIHEPERVHALLNNSENGSVLKSPEGLSKLLSTHSKRDISFSKDQAGSKSSISINGIGTQSSNDIHEMERVYPLLNNSESDSMLKSPEGLSKWLSTDSKRDFSFSQDQAGSKSSISINGIGTQSSNDIHELERVYAQLNNSESGFVLNSPEGLSKFLATHSKKDVPTILNVMHSLSELLVQTCSDDFGSLNEHKHDLIQHIINNLCMCIQHRAGGKIPISDVTLTGTPYRPNKSTEFGKCSNMGFQVTRTKALAVPHELDYQNGHEGLKVNSHVFTERMLDSFSSRSAIGTERRNDIIQVMGNTLRDSHMTQEELDPQALVYKKLWLEAQAELCSMKYETCVLCMKLEMCGRQFDKNKVSGKLLTREMHRL